MSRVIQICEIENAVIARLLSEYLDEQNITYNIHESAVPEFPGHTHSAYAIIESLEENRELIISAIANIKAYADDNPVDQEPVDEGYTQHRKSLSFWKGFFIVLGLIYLLFTIKIWIDNNKMRSFLNEQSKNFHVRLNRDGYKSFYKSNPLFYVHYFDQNRDNNYEKIEIYGLKGNLLEVNHDWDENGIYEEIIHYSPEGSVDSEYYDQNEDLIFDQQRLYLDSSVNYMVLIDQDFDGMYDIIQLYQDNKLTGTSDYDLAKLFD